MTTFSDVRETDVIRVVTVHRVGHLILDVCLQEKQGYPFWRCMSCGRGRVARLVNQDLLVHDRCPVCNRPIQVTVQRFPRLSPLRPKMLPTRDQFVAAKMANLLFALAQNQAIPAGIREQAEQLARQWDRVASFRLDNPVLAAQLEAWFGLDQDLAI